MVDPGFAEDEYLQQMIGSTVQFDDHSRSAFEMNGAYYGRLRLTNIFVPLGMKQYSYDYRELSHYVPAVFYWIYQNAEFMRWSVVDESIPLHDRDGVLSLNGESSVFCIYDGCRQSNVTALTGLRYWPALPEFREAMLHERDRYMRSLCVEAIGSMGKRALIYAKDIRESIRKFSNEPLYLVYAIEALAKLDDKSAASMLRELYEETRARISRLTFDEAMEKVRDWIYLIEDIVSAIIRLDPDSARDILAMELTDPNSHVRHFVKSAFMFSPLRYDVELIGSSLTSAIASLPEDPRWIFRRHRDREHL